MTSERKVKIRAPKPTWSWWYWRDRTMMIADYTTLDVVIEHNYTAFVRGEAYTDYIRMPDGTRLQHSVQDDSSAENERDTLSEVWDEWLISRYTPASSTRGAEAQIRSQ